MTKITYKFSEPIVIDRRKKRKKKKKTSFSVDLQQSERHLTRGMLRTLRATEEGVVRYRKASKKSAKKKNDGMIVDLLPNMVEGTVVTASGLALLPLDLMRAVYTPQTRRLMRRSIRATMRLNND